MDAVCRDVTPIHLLWLWYQAVHQRHTTQLAHERGGTRRVGRHGDECRRIGEQGRAVHQYHGLIGGQLVPRGKAWARTNTVRPTHSCGWRIMPACA